VTTNEVWTVSRSLMHSKNEYRRTRVTAQSRCDGDRHRWSASLRAPAQLCFRSLLRGQSIAAALLLRRAAVFVGSIRGISLALQIEAQ